MIGSLSIWRSTLPSMFETVLDLYLIDGHMDWTVLVQRAVPNRPDNFLVILLVFLCVIIC